MRNWISDYFSHNYVITKDMYKLLKDVKSNNNNTD